MILFIHGTAATRSLWYRHIRSILALHNDIKNPYIRDTFTLALPGHDQKDEWFTFPSIRQEINDFTKHNYTIQRNLAHSMILTHPKYIIDLLQSPKLFLIGHSVGGALALEYTMKEPDKVSHLLTISAHAQFNAQYIEAMEQLLNIYEHLPQNWRNSLHRLAPTLRWRVALQIIRDNPKRKGIRSCIAYLKQFNFKTLFSHSSLEDQMKFLSLKYLNICGNFDVISSPLKASSFNKFLDTKIQEDVFAYKRKRSLHQQYSFLYYPAGHEPMDSHSERFFQDVHTFIST